MMVTTSIELKVLCGACGKLSLFREVLVQERKAATLLFYVVLFILLVTATTATSYVTVLR